MKKRMTRADAEAFVRRWQRAGQAERDEARRTDPVTRPRQLAALMASVDTFGWRGPWMKARKKCASGGESCAKPMAS